MELNQHIIEPAVFKYGQQSSVLLAAGQSLRIETTPNGIEVLDTECPAGKVWSVRVIVEVTETDTT